MTRKIRDKIYEKYKYLSPEEFILKLSQEAKKSELWKIKNNNSG
jgi:hypothetical protein